MFFDDAAKSGLPFRVLYVRKPASAKHRGFLIVGSHIMRATCGRSGVHPKKYEGDGRTPQGTWTIQTNYTRRRSFVNPELQRHQIKSSPSMGWCDDPSSVSYNKPIGRYWRGVDAKKRKSWPSHEKIYRDDGLYDCLWTVNWNEKPTIPARGSSIFIHLWRKENGVPVATAGCIAISGKNMKFFCNLMRKSTTIVVGSSKKYPAMR